MALEPTSTVEGMPITTLLRQQNSTTTKCYFQSIIAYTFWFYGFGTAISDKTHEKHWNLFFFIRFVLIFGLRCLFFFRASPFSFLNFLYDSQHALETSQYFLIDALRSSSNSFAFRIILDSMNIKTMNCGMWDFPDHFESTVVIFSRTQNAVKLPVRLLAPIARGESKRVARKNEKNRNLGGHKKCHKPQSSKRQKVVVLRGELAVATGDLSVNGRGRAHLEYLVWACCELWSSSIVMLHAILTLSAFIELNYKGMDARWQLFFKPKLAATQLTNLVLSDVTANVHSNRAWILKTWLLTLLHSHTLKLKFICLLAWYVCPLSIHL